MMIQDQIPTGSNYRFPRANYYNFTAKKAQPSSNNQQLDLADPHSKLLFIGKSLQKLNEYQFLGIRYVQDYLLALYRRNRSINTIRTKFDAMCRSRNSFDSGIS